MPSTSRSLLAKLKQEERDLRRQAAVNLLDAALEGEVGQQDEIVQRRLADRIQALADAREQLRQGSYSTCKDCGRRIPQRRLEAMPTATLCVRCQEKVEGARAACGPCARGETGVTRSES